jgi:hypothetical protein
VSRRSIDRGSQGVRVMAWQASAGAVLPTVLAQYYLLAFRPGLGDMAQSVPKA